jgi:hypothetical protein
MVLGCRGIASCLLHVELGAVAALNRRSVISATLLQLGVVARDAQPRFRHAQAM